MADLVSQFHGCLLGAMVGDVAGAVVEAESPGYIRKTYRSVDDILAQEEVPEVFGRVWKVGRFTDDTQMMLGVCEWLVEDETLAPQSLLRIFARNFEDERRYGPGTEGILRVFPEHEANWRDLATMQFPNGSYGNGSAMRVAPVGLLFHRDFQGLLAAAVASSRTTHSHRLARQGAVLQASAVAAAVRMRPLDTTMFLKALRLSLAEFDRQGQETSEFDRALDCIGAGLARDSDALAMARILGNGIKALEAVPMAIFCFLNHTTSYRDAVQDAIFIGGDTDTIACMAGAISGAYLGEEAIPDAWTGAVREERHTPAFVRDLAARLFQRFGQLQSVHRPITPHDPSQPRNP